MLPLSDDQDPEQEKDQEDNEAENKTGMSPVTLTIRDYEPLTQNTVDRFFRQDPTIFNRQHVSRLGKKTDFYLSNLYVQFLHMHFLRIHQLDPYKTHSIICYQQNSNGKKDADVFRFLQKPPRSFQPDDDDDQSSQYEFTVQQLNWVQVK